MIIGILSDTHDNIWALENAISHLELGDIIIHCGDLCSPFIVVKMGQGLEGKPVHVVWGNNDGDQRLLTMKAQEVGNVYIHGEYAELDIDGLSVAVTHYPEIARPVFDSGKYDLVCYGHDHTAYQERKEKRVLLNPGEVMGLNGSRSIAIYDTASQEVEFVDID